MSRSLRVDPKYIQKVNLALKRNGYPSQRKFAEDIVPCLSTVKNFLKGKPVDYENFREICERLGHLKILKQLIPNVPFEIMFDIASEDTEDLTPQPPSLRGKGEHESNSPLLAGEGLGERSTEE